MKIYPENYTKINGLTCEFWLHAAGKLWCGGYARWEKTQLVWYLLENGNSPDEVMKKVLVRLERLG